MSASDAPVRLPGTRTRSGNAMVRTRSALLDATADCLARYGIRKTTMVDVAARSGVAKATLYNHFRTKDDLLTAYVEDRVAALVGHALTAAPGGLPAALGVVAGALAADPALRRAATEEPALLAPLASPSPTRGWQLARDGVAAVLDAAGCASGAPEVDAVLRWFTSQLLWPAGEAELVPMATGSAAPLPESVAELSPAVGWPAG